MALNQIRHIHPTPLVVSGLEIRGGTISGGLIGDVQGNVNATTGVSTFRVISGVGTAGISSAYISTLNDGPLAGYRNRIINGDFRIDQRNVGAAQSISAGAALTYTVDRWFAYSAPVAIRGQQLTGIGSGAPVQNRYVFTGFNQATSTSVLFGQRIESQNTHDLAGQVATLSVDIAHSASLTDTTGIGWTAFHPNYQPDTFGPLNTPTKTAFATGTILVNGSNNRYSATFPVAIGATMGIEIIFSATGISTSGPGIAATSLPGGAAGGGLISFGNVQLERGPVATPFERRNYTHELMLCQRYYEKTFAQNIAPAQNVNTFAGSITGTGSATNVTFGAQWWFKVEKFATPSVVTFTPNAASATWSTNTTTPTLAGAIFGNSGIYLNGTTAVTAGNNYSIHAIAFSEL